ncbi:MAG: hypothetical protein DRQ52_12125 [Gammaproteobacteria bacterium]|nr:MAG: hypothetical protein DRQ52_12125 [Gammaproteobacteria bacterium]
MNSRRDGSWLGIADSFDRLKKLGDSILMASSVADIFRVTEIVAKLEEGLALILSQKKLGWQSPSGCIKGLFNTKQLVEAPAKA